jgi:hypothetical protein
MGRLDFTPENIEEYQIILSNCRFQVMAGVVNEHIYLIIQPEVAAGNTGNPAISSTAST